MRSQINSKFERLATISTQFAGSSAAFLLAFSMILVWGILGPVFHFSELWQIVINTTTTIITFLMVFLIQRSQNKDALSIQLKLNELIASIEGASNRLINAESMTEDELKILQKYYGKLVVISRKEENLKKSHSVEEAESDALKKNPKNNPDII